MAGIGRGAGEIGHGVGIIHPIGARQRCGRVHQRIEGGLKLFIAGHQVANPRADAALKADIERENKAKNKINFQTAEDVRYNQRSSAERVNSNLKDNFGGKHVRVRGNSKVYTHLMFGLLSITALQLMRLVT